MDEDIANIASVRCRRSDSAHALSQWPSSVGFPSFRSHRLSPPPLAKASHLPKQWQTKSLSTKAIEWFRKPRVYRQKYALSTIPRKCSVEDYRAGAFGEVEERAHRARNWGQISTGRSGEGEAFECVNESSWDCSRWMSRLRRKRPEASFRSTNCVNKLAYLFPGMLRSWRKEKRRCIVSKCLSWSV